MVYTTNPIVMGFFDRFSLKKTLNFYLTLKKVCEKGLIFPKSSNIIASVKRKKQENGKAVRKSVAQN